MKNAFTLVELSIVLVILGLLVGGVLAGQSLIRAAELRSVVTELTTYQTAAITFREKYFALPADMDNATAFWGEMGDAGTGDCATNVAGTGTETCDGNKNGIVRSAAGTNERFTFWQHLSNAGLIEGAYNGTEGAGSGEHAIGGVNAPSGRISSSVWYITSRGEMSGSSLFFDGLYNSYFLYGGQDDDQEPSVPILTPAEMWGIDTKLDDGMPATGKTVVRPIGLCTDGAGSADSGNFDSEYNLANEDPACNAVFRDNF